ncbi:MAG: L,D-transpeptidase family protein [Acidiferrobacterales bacterium]
MVDCEIEIDVPTQTLVLRDRNTGENVITVKVSTAANGTGEKIGSEKTPRGRHVVCARIGEAQPVNSVLVGRRPTGEIYTAGLRKVHPQRDWILTRILWLKGCEKGRNRMGNVDTMRRYIYIHGAPDDIRMGAPGSRGCIRMRNEDIVRLFDLVQVGTPVVITGES